MSDPNLHEHEHKHKHKRRRTDQDGPCHCSRRSCAAEPSAPAPGPGPGPGPTQSTSSMASGLREHLQRSLDDLQRCSARIQSLLHSTDLGEARTRSALVELSAPVQPTTTTPIAQNDVKGEGECQRCASLSSRIAALEAQAAIHENEKQAWSAFKTWWLASLDKRQRARRSNNHTNNRNQQQHAHEHRHNQAESELHPGSTKPGGWTNAVADKLDRKTRGIWERAGILPLTTDANRDGDGDGDGGSGSSSGEERGADKSDITPSQGDSTSSNPTRHEQSEPTLPLHAPSPLSPPASPAPPCPATRDANTDRTVERVGYVDTQPIRRRQQRRTLIASDCPECTLFYSHLNNLTSTQANASKDQRWGDREKHACSRHRSTFQRATTPEGYWNIGFPTTQQAQQINTNANRDTHATKHHVFN